jgi:DNA-binding transcriptional MerR regulator
MVDSIVTVGPTARRLELSEARVRQLADAGVLPSRRSETGVRIFRVEDVERFARTRRLRRRDVEGPDAE